MKSDNKEKKERKPYEKPEMVSEKILETFALQCGRCTGSPMMPGPVGPRWCPPSQQRLS